jgi:hypothetical protein
MTNTNNQLNIDVEKLRKRSVFLGVPAYGGQMSGYTTKSLLDLTVTLNNFGIKSLFFGLFNESLISRARNYCAAEFMRSGFTDLLFIDSDIEFDPMDVIAMLQITENDNDKDIIGGFYPKKSIAWEKIVQAVNMGFADANPFWLEQYMADFVFNPVADGVYKMNEPMEVMELGTGFMLIQRHVFEEWDRQHPEYLYTPDSFRSKSFDGSSKIMAYFQDPIINDRHLSEDYFFCRKSREMGMHVWGCPWMKVNHIGTMKFIGNLPAVAATGSSPTVDANAVKGLKEI